MKSYLLICFSIAKLLSSSLQSEGQLLKVGIAGLSHDHVHGILQQYKKGEVIIEGISESDEKLVARYKKTFQLPDSLFFKNIFQLLKHIKPDVVLAYNPVSEHVDVVEACAPLGLSVMVEKPLAVSYKQAERMAFLAHKYHIHLLTNYETTWYSSYNQLYELVNNQNAVGDIRKIIVHDGHSGPIEIGCSRDFTNWLTDPVKNGGGALMDFGCYGANLMTWLMMGKAPVAVSAIARHIKPKIYNRVDDDATIVLEYPEATGIIEASWNWPFSIKDLEVFGKTGYFHALNGNALQQRMNNKDEYSMARVEPFFYHNNISYLTEVLKGKIQSENDLSSLSNNLVVMKILDAARTSVKEGKKIYLNISKVK